MAFGRWAHSGWAAMVEVAGTAYAPRVPARHGIVIADREAAGSKAGGAGFSPQGKTGHTVD